MLRLVPRCQSAALLLSLALPLAVTAVRAETQTPTPETGAFVHPGGLHTQADLDRMKAKVAARETPWIEGWEELLKDPLAKADYRSGARPNLGDSRQRASADAHAAYLNFIRWYISGERAHADAAIRICNEWSAAANQVPTGGDIPGLSGIPISELAMVGELLRVCPHWEKADQERFKRMMREHFYPVVHGFLADRNRLGDNRFWANWDIANIQALLAMGILLDDRAIFDEGLEYFKNGRGTGSIMNTVPFLHPGGLGQWQESGRDQPHAQLGVGMMAQICQLAWNQGVDLFGYADHRLLAGAEYVARTALSLDVPYQFYTNDTEARNYWLSPHTRGRFTAPVWEILYNHYVVRRGLAAPNVEQVAKLARPERGGGDHFGYGTLTFTLDAAASPYPPLPAPAAPSSLTANPGLGRIYLSWNVAEKNDANGYVVRRASAKGGKFETIAEWSNNTAPRHTDLTAKPGVAYRYTVAARNQAGVGPDSAPVEATAAAPGPLPDGWKTSRIGGRASSKVKADYSVAGGRTLRLEGTGRIIGGTADDASFAYGTVKGDFQLTARLMGPLPDELTRSNLSKFGLMVRESLKPDARIAAVTLGEGGLRGTRAFFRAERGAGTAVAPGNDYTWSPVWYRLRREGNVFIASHSDDAKNWFEVGRATIDMPAEALVGFALCVRNADKPGDLLFESINLEH